VRLSLVLAHPRSSGASAETGAQPAPCWISGEHYSGAAFSNPTRGRASFSTQQHSALAAGVASKCA
jgi:hypothetical protein